MRPKGEKIKFIEMPSAELIKYLVDVQYPYLIKAFAAFSLAGKSIAYASGDAPGAKIMADLIRKLESLVRNLLEQDEKEFFSCLSQLSLDKPVNALPDLLTHIRKQHASIVKLFKKLRMLSGEYSAPEHASATVKLCYAQLFNFEQDMLKHIFLEEDILFPKLLATNKQKTIHYGRI